MTSPADQRLAVRRKGQALYPLPGTVQSHASPASDRIPETDFAVLVGNTAASRQDFAIRRKGQTLHPAARRPQRTTFLSRRCIPELDFTWFLQTRHGPIAR